MHKRYEGQKLYNQHTNIGIGHATAQAVSCRLLIAAAQVRSQVRSCGICGGQRGTRARFFRVLRFPLPIFILPTATHSSSTIIRGGTMGQIVADMPSGLSPTQRNNNKKQHWNCQEIAHKHVIICSIYI
jgi:hypothetical protein